MMFSPCTTINKVGSEPADESGQGRVAFRYPNFRRFLAARFLAQAAGEMQAVAVGWQVYGITHRPLDLGLVGLAQFLPGVLLFLVAGQTADRFRRERILQICFAAFAIVSATLAALSWNGLTAVWPIYLVLVMQGTVRAFTTPAAQSLIPLTVPTEHFPNAVAWASSVFQGAMVLGPAIGGAVYGAAGSPVPVYVASCVCCLTGAGQASRLRIGRAQATAVQTGLLEGLRYLRRAKIVLGAVSLDLFAVLLGGAVALLPVYARDILKVGALGLGILRGAPSFGAVTMAIVLAHWPLRKRAGAVMLWAVAGFGLFTIVFALSRNVLLSLVALIFVGGCDMVSVILRHTLVQLWTPDEMRGRVSAVNMVFISTSNEVGQFESGLTAQWFGTVPAAALGGIGTILVVILWAILFPDLRRVSGLHPKLKT
jgi:MFS family permease